MEYLLDTDQSKSAAQVVGEGLTPDALEEEIERLRLAFYRLKFGGTAGDIDLSKLSRRAYLIATLVAGDSPPYPQN